MENKHHYEEHVHQIWNEDGWRHEVGTDPDGLGMIELRYVEDDGRCTQRLGFSPEIAEELCAAIMEQARRQRGSEVRPVLPGCVRVRIAVATARDPKYGDIYNASGWSFGGAKPVGDHNKIACAKDGIETGDCLVTFVEADVPLPEVPLTVHGTVTKADV